MKARKRLIVIATRDGDRLFEIAGCILILEDHILHIVLLNLLVEEAIRHLTHIGWITGALCKELKQVPAQKHRNYQQ